MPLLLVVVCERSRASYNAGRESSRCSLPRVLFSNTVHTACPAISFAFASRPPKMIGRTLHRLCSFYCAVCAGAGLPRLDPRRVEANNFGSPRGVE